MIKSITNLAIMTELTTELSALALISMFTGIIWVPIILNRLLELGIWTALQNPQPDVRAKAEWAYRLANAHRNAIENLAVFAPLILILSLLQLTNEMTAMVASVFVIARIAHAVIYTLGIPFFRTLAFAIGFGCQLVLCLRIFDMA